MKRLRESSCTSATPTARARGSLAKARTTPVPNSGRCVACAIAPFSAIESPEFQTTSKPRSSASRASSGLSASAV